MRLYFSSFFKHLKTVLYHRHLVMIGCFKVGLYKQGLFHDLSKFSPAEFWVGVKYFQGTQSPNNAERKEIGYSSAWLHHKGRNKHHYEYWIDYSIRALPSGIAPAPMPLKYVAEMLMDRVAACKVYNHGTYTDASALIYYQSGKDPAPIHEDTRKLLEFLLNKLACEGEKETYGYLRKLLKGNAKPKSAP
ncbi:MAG: DUF5662 family protein [Lachnospiraceae bacterium]|nr:DUF5662 family protein [Lachnospiraceae bacterium]